MSCESCGTNMQYLGRDGEGTQLFTCEQPTCKDQHKQIRRWWESGTDFQIESVE